MDQFAQEPASARASGRGARLCGYWVISVRVLDPQRYAIYLEAATDAIDRLGGTMIIRSQDFMVGAGSPKPRLVVVEFESLARAQEAFHDVAQQAAMLLFDGIAEYDLAVVEGYDDRR